MQCTRSPRQRFAGISGKQLREPLAELLLEPSAELLIPVPAERGGLVR